MTVWARFFVLVLGRPVRVDVGIERQRSKKGQRKSSKLLYLYSAKTPKQNASAFEAQNRLSIVLWEGFHTGSIQKEGQLADSESKKQKRRRDQQNGIEKG